MTFSKALDFFNIDPLDFSQIFSNATSFIVASQNSLVLPLVDFIFSLLNGSAELPQFVSPVLKHTFFDNIYQSFLETLLEISHRFSEAREYISSKLLACLGLSLQKDLPTNHLLSRLAVALSSTGLLLLEIHGCDLFFGRRHFSIMLSVLLQNPYFIRSDLDAAECLSLLEFIKLNSFKPLDETVVEKIVKRFLEISNYQFSPFICRILLEYPNLISSDVFGLLFYSQLKFEITPVHSEYATADPNVIKILISNYFSNRSIFERKFSGKSFVDLWFNKEFRDGSLSRKYTFSLEGLVLMFLVSAEVSNEVVKGEFSRLHRSVHMVSVKELKSLLKIMSNQNDGKELVGFLLELFIATILVAMRQNTLPLVNGIVELLQVTIDFLNEHSMNVQNHNFLQPFFLQQYCEVIEYLSSAEICAPSVIDYFLKVIDAVVCSYSKSYGDLKGSFFEKFIKETLLGFINAFVQSDTFPALLPSIISILSHSALSFPSASLLVSSAAKNLIKKLVCMGKESKLKELFPLAVELYAFSIEKTLLTKTPGIRTEDWEFLLEAETIDKSFLRSLSSLPDFLSNPIYMQRCADSLHLIYVPILTETNHAELAVKCIPWINKDNGTIFAEKCLLSSAKAIFARLSLSASTLTNIMEHPYAFDEILASTSIDLQFKEAISSITLIIGALLPLFQTAFSSSQLITQLLELATEIFKALLHFLFALQRIQADGRELDVELGTDKANDLVLEELLLMQGRLTKALYLLIPYSQTIDVEAYKLINAMDRPEPGKARLEKQYNKVVVDSPLENEKVLNDDVHMKNNRDLMKGFSIDKSAKQKSYDFLAKKVRRESKVIPKLIYHIELLEKWLLSSPDSLLPKEVRTYIM